jgi:hypothetical protein
MVLSLAIRLPYVVVAHSIGVYPRLQIVKVVLDLHITVDGMFGGLNTANMPLLQGLMAIDAQPTDANAFSALRLGGDSWQCSV